MNYAGVIAPLFADIGFSPRECYLYLFPAFLGGMPPCFIEASDRPEGTLYPLACSDILYEGQSPRTWYRTGES
jgi:hypothetical protein